MKEKGENQAAKRKTSWLIFAGVLTFIIVAVGPGVGIFLASKPETTLNSTEPVDKPKKSRIESKEPEAKQSFRRPVKKNKVRKVFRKQKVLNLTQVILSSENSTVANSTKQSNTTILLTKSSSTSTSTTSTTISKQTTDPTTTSIYPTTLATTADKKQSTNKPTTIKSNSINCCKQGWTKRDINGKFKCLKYVSNTVAQFAYSTCKTLGAKLPLPLNEAENLSYYTTFKELYSGVKVVPLDLTDSKVEGQWKTYDGKSLVFTKWDLNEPSNFNAYDADYCAFHYRYQTKIQKAWDDIHSAYKVQVICELPCL